jgi:hypothetical protein
MRSISALVLGVSLFVSPLAMAGGLSSSDSGFLFSKDQVSATTISSQEMQSTQGKQLSSFFDFIIAEFGPALAACQNSGNCNVAGIMVVSVTGSGNIFCVSATSTSPPCP